VIYRDIPRPSRCRMANQSPKGKNTWFKRDKWWSQSHGFTSISRHRNPSKRKDHLIRPTIPSIFCNQLLNCVRSPFGVVSSFMQITPDLIRPGSLKKFIRSILWELPTICPISWVGTVRLFYSDIYSIFWRDFPVIRKKYFLTQLTQFWGESQKPLWMLRSGTGWRDWCRSPHTQIIIIHKANPRLSFFVLPGSGTAMLNPRWTSSTWHYFVDEYMRQPLLMKLSIIKRDENCLSSDIVSIALAWVTS
jgi:hypothetical protein